MRNAIMFLFTLSLSGCLYGTSRGETIVTHDTVNPDGTVRRESFTSSSNGSTVGASLPGLFGGYGTIGGAYGGAYMIGGGYGGGNTACVLHPDRCAAMQIATVVQPVSISSSGGGYAAGGRSGSGGGTVAETDDAELTAMLAKHEKAISALAGGSKQKGRQLCQILIANPDAITDTDEREEVITACQRDLAKRPYKPTKTAKKEDK